MKSFIYIGVILFSINTQACEVRNEDYKIIIEHDKNLINYQITKKDKGNISFFTYNLIADKKIGFRLQNSTEKILDVESLNIMEKLNYFKNEDFNFFTPYSPATVGSYTFPLDKNQFKEQDIIIGRFDLNDFIETVRSEEIRHNQKILPYGKQVLIPKVKVILDSEMKTCIDFKGEPFKYNFGNKYVYNIKIWWFELKEKTEQTWKAIVE